MTDRPLSDSLLALYKLTGRGPSLEFSRQAFVLLHARVPFDSGLWGTFMRTPEGPWPHWGYLHALPQQMLDEYEHGPATIACVPGRRSSRASNTRFFFQNSMQGSGVGTAWAFGVDAGK